MITLKEALIIHELAIKEFGGSFGVRDINLLESAIQRPNATFDGQDLYPNPIDKAAAIFESIVKNHPFSDGNKRTGYILMRLILLKSNLDITATEKEKYKFVIKVAEGKLSFAEIKLWIQNNI
ncbi:MAG: type II toxin-antitoxin system death-on-curing family toxin [Saprospiraceae bacterium]